MITTTDILTLLALANYVWFFLGVWTVFRREGEPGVGLRFIGLGALVAAVVIVWALRTADAVPTWRSALAGAMWIGTLAGFAACGRATRDQRLSVAFSPDLPRFTIRSGPYAWVRHPFYTVYTTSYLAGFVATGAWSVAAVTVAMFAIYVWAARTEEAKFARSEVASDYAAYRASTGMFLPRPGRATSPSETTS